MAKRTCISFFSLLLLIAGSSAVVAQDTVTVPLHLRAGFDISGPLLKFVNKELVSYGILTSVDVTEAITLNAGMRYSSFHSVRHSYDFTSRGMSIVTGAEYNFLKANVSEGKYYAGLGLRYGLSLYSEEAPVIRYTNMWGEGVSSIPLSRHAGHFVEITPGFRTELFPVVTIGWNLYMRLLISAGAGNDLKPVWMPGYGPATKGMATAAEYYISFSIPYKRKKVIIMPKAEDDEEEEGDVSSTTNSPGTSSGFGGRL
jgi:hypothetical protein